MQSWTDFILLILEKTILVIAAIWMKEWTWNCLMDPDSWRVSLVSIAQQIVCFIVVVTLWNVNSVMKTIDINYYHDGQLWGSLPTQANRYKQMMNISFYSNLSLFHLRSLADEVAFQCRQVSGMLKSACLTSEACQSDFLSLRKYQIENKK